MVKWFSTDHSYTTKWQSLHLNPGTLALEPKLLTLVQYCSILTYLLLSKELGAVLQQYLSILVFLSQNWCYIVVPFYKYICLIVLLLNLFLDKMWRNQAVSSVASSTSDKLCRRAGADFRLPCAWFPSNHVLQRTLYSGDSHQSKPQCSWWWVMWADLTQEMTVEVTLRNSLVHHFLE